MSAPAVAVRDVAGEGLLARINGRWHRQALIVYGVIVVGHSAEHVIQILQIWVFGMARQGARGVLGYFYPWLDRSEWLHFGYAFAMLVGLVLLLPGFGGRSRTAWKVALGIQIWHLIEHSLLLYQALAHHNLFTNVLRVWRAEQGKAARTSVLQLIFPRVELHIFYTVVVMVPLLLALWWHVWPTPDEKAAVACSCANHSRAAAG